MIASSRTPAAFTSAMDCSKKLIIALITSPDSASSAARLCIKIQAAPCCPITCAIRGSRCPPHTSFTISAPARSAASATSLFDVSIDINALVAERTRSTKGTTRAISSEIGTGTCPGRVDSPPISIIVAPSSIIR